ncbi:unnamed protein product [Caenorhabditis sp. 36 PRJEB53466]|nr:unnamed protein product [Caenorhabditis sp. 36 PRJEB53466]
MCEEENPGDIPIRSYVAKSDNHADDGAILSILKWTQRNIVSLILHLLFYGSFIVSWIAFFRLCYLSCQVQEGIERCRSTDC